MTFTILPARVDTFANDTTPIHPPPDQVVLPKVLGTRDLTIFTLLTVVTLGSFTTLQSGGPTAFLYIGLSLLFFVLPRIIVTNWLNKQFTDQETPYHWTLDARGRGLSIFAAFSVWWPGVLVVVSTIEACVEVSHFFVPSPLWANSRPLLRGIMVSMIFCTTTLVACLPMRWVKRLLFAMALPYLVLLVILGATGVWWILSSHPLARSFAFPTQWSFNTSNMGGYGLIVMSLLGMHVPLFLKQEVRAEKGGSSKIVSRFLWLSSFLVVGIMLLGTLGVMVIVPPEQASTLTAPVIAMMIVFNTPYTMPIVTNILALGLGTIVLAALVVYSRLLVVLAQEKVLPQQLTHTNRYGVPVFSIMVQAVISGTLAMLIFVVMPFLVAQISAPAQHVLGLNKDTPLHLYIAVQASSSIIFAVMSSLTFVLAIFVLFKRRQKQGISLKQCIVLCLLSVLGFGAYLYAIWLVLTRSWLPTPFVNSMWTLLLSSIIVVSIVLGWLISMLPRVQAALQEQQRLNVQEARLRSQLQESYVQQQVLLEEVDMLCREHAQAAVTDAITGLPNHRAVMNMVDDIVLSCQRTQRSCAVLFTDLDHFKRVNDTWGHRAGDAILREVGWRFRATLREQDFVGRYGGEEFAILLADTEIEQAIQIAERLRVAVNAEPCIWQEDGQAPLAIPVTTSIGVAVYRLHGVNRETLIISADQAMYRAKKTGRNRVCVADIEQESMIEPQPTSERCPGEAEAVQALAAAASAHDGSTHEHAHRMVRLAEETARQLGRSEDEVHLIRLAALLHDIGKIGIPDAILHKPGPLTSDEWAVMRSHPDIGRTILEQTGGILRLLSNIVVAHHERWDGAGYPSQLTGENIPLGARILSVVDSYDAMISHRAYREPRTIEEASAELQRCVGSQFDPQVVEAFLAVLYKQQQELLLV